MRNESCALLYLIMKENYDFTTRKDFVRVHLQVSASIIIGPTGQYQYYYLFDFNQTKRGYYKVIKVCQAVFTAC